MNKPVYIGLPIPELSEILIYEIWYEIWYLKPKYGEKAKGCYMDAESFIVYKKNPDDIYKNNTDHVETWFDTPNYELDRPLTKGENKKIIVLMKDELAGKIMTKFVGLRGKTYSYLVVEGGKDKKAKHTKKRVIKRNLNLKNLKTV